MPRTPQPVNPAASPWHLLGATMRHWRDDVRQLSQRDIAGVVHVDHTMISAWERATSRPDISSVRAIDEALGTDGQITALHIFIAELDRLRRSKTDINPPVREEDDVERRALLQILTVLGAGAGVPASAVDALHAGLRQITGTPPRTARTTGSRPPGITHRGCGPNRRAQGSPTWRATSAPWTRCWPAPRPRRSTPPCCVSTPN